jgi:hypothetical protein
MSAWYPGWQLLLAWLLIAVIAGVFYFGPITPLLVSLKE